MKYSFACPAGDYTATAEAKNDDEAVDKLMALGNKHAAQAHSDMASVPDAEMRKLVRAQMKKG